MFDEVYIEIPGPPQAKESVRAGRYKNFYNPSKIAMDATKNYLRSTYTGPLFTGALHVIFVFEMPIPEKWPYGKQVRAMLGFIPHIVKPDVDNMQKFYGDCMSKIIYKDDSQIVRPECCKYYSEIPRTRIWIIPIVKPLYIKEKDAKKKLCTSTATCKAKENESKESAT